MADIADVDLGSFFNLNNLLWLALFVGSMATMYWRLRNYLSNKNKKYIEDISKQTAKTIIENVTNDNMVSELNFKDKIESARETLQKGLDKELSSIHECNKRVEQKLEKHDERLQEMDKTLSSHIAQSAEQTKSLDRVIGVVNNALGIVKPVVELEVTKKIEASTDSNAKI